jgi:uncharacterized transporter YbjL
MREHDDEDEDGDGEREGYRGSRPVVAAEFISRFSKCQRAPSTTYATIYPCAMIPAATTLR